MVSMVATDLRGFLAAQGISQKRLAEGIGVSESTVSKWFTRGNGPTKENIDATLRFCRQYAPDVTYEDLFPVDEAA